MIDRMQRIRAEFGNAAFAKTLLLLFGLALMAVIGFALLGRPDAAIIGAVGLAVGAFFRDRIADRAESLHIIFKIGLFVYGIVLFLGDMLRFNNVLKLSIIALTTVLVFNFQFWSLSDKDVFKAELE